MPKKTSPDEKRLTRKAMLVGAAIGIIVMPIFFFVVSSDSDLTNEKIMWLLINGSCSGILLGGGIGYLLTNNDIRFY